MVALGFAEQAQFAEKLGVSRQYVNELLKDKSAVGERVLSGLAALGVNVNWILTGRGPMLTDGTPEPPAEGAELLETLRDNAALWKSRCGDLEKEVGRLQGALEIARLASARGTLGPSTVREAAGLTDEELEGLAFLKRGDPEIWRTVQKLLAKRR